jgi:Family of unknown function (DUF5719)
MRLESKRRKSGIVMLAVLALLVGFLTPFALNTTAVRADGFDWSSTGGVPTAYGASTMRYDGVHDILYAGFNTYNLVHGLISSHGIWRCTNPESSPSWSLISGGGGPGDINAERLEYDSARNLLYASIVVGMTAQVWRCNNPDTSPSWTKISSGAIDTFAGINGLVCDSDSNLLYVCDTEDLMTSVGQGVWRCSNPDSSPSWTEISSPSDVGDVNNGTLLYDAANDVLYDGSYPSNVWRCESPGSSHAWTNLGGGGGWVLGFALDDSRNILYAEVWKGVTYRIDNPLTSPSWTDLGGPADYFGDIVYDNQRNELYEGVRQSLVTTTPPFGVKRCANPDASPSWSNTGGAIGPYDTRALALGASGDTLFAGTFLYGAWKTPLPTFYFAEGYTGTNFQEYICLGNPNDYAAQATITYMFTDGSTQQEQVQIQPNSRSTVNVNASVGAGKDVSAKIESGPNIVAERPMYFNYNGVWSGGHDAVGATGTSNTWYFAEGYTGPGFDEWVCVLNPGGTQANLTFFFQTQEEGEKKVEGLSVSPHSRGSFKANDLLGGKSYQTSLKLTSDQAVVAERPMYFDYTGTANWHWTGGHCVMGVSSLAKQYYFAEGTTRSGFEEWLTLQNPNPAEITINAVYQLGAGQGDPIIKSYNVPASGRTTIFVPGPDAVGAAGKDVSVFLASASDFLAERPVYFSYSYSGLNANGGHCVIGSPRLASEWFFAEGYTGNNFNQWLCLQNPGDTDSTCEITYYTQEAGALPVRTETVPARSRITFMVNENAGPGYQLSTRVKVTSGPGIVAERPMYFIYNGWDGGHDVVGYAP